MLLGIDHLVIAARDPDAAASAIERDLGIAFTGGGRHDAWGTFNRLAFLGDTYLELIGVFDRALVASSGSAVGRATLAVLDAGREGMATFAVATDDIGGDVARLRAAGSAIAPPVDGSRVRPDGEVVRWRTAAAWPLGPCEPPFLIEHESTGAEWGEAARAGRQAFEHPGGRAGPTCRARGPVRGSRRRGERVPDDRRARLRAIGCRPRRGSRRRASGAAVGRCRRRARRGPRRRVAGAHRHRAARDPVAMRALAGVLVVLAVGLGACGSVGPVTDADPANDAVVPTPVPGAPGVSAPPSSPG